MNPKTTRPAAIHQNLERIKSVLHFLPLGSTRRGKGNIPVKVLNVLSGHNDVHSPETGDDVHGQNDGSQYRQSTEDVRRLFLSLVHFDVDLRQVVAMATREDLFHVVQV